MALITCMPQARRGSRTPAGEPEVEEREAMEMDDHLQHEDHDSGCECSLEELEGMDAWTKTMVAIRVLTAFKKRRKKRLEEEQSEKVKKERRKTLWRRLGFKLRIFNVSAKKISSDDPTEERIIKLKRKLGKLKTGVGFLCSKYIWFICFQVISALKLRKKHTDIRGR
jgi:hypothetical protein